MTDIAYTAAKIAPVFPEKAEIYDFIAAEAITAGQPVYFVAASGKVGLADANGSGTIQFRGVALTTVAAGSAVSVLKKGHVYGYTITSLNYDAILYLSNTAGSFADSAGGTTVNCGRVVALSESSLTKVVYIEADWLRTWS